MLFLPYLRQPIMQHSALNQIPILNYHSLFKRILKTKLNFRKTNLKLKILIQQTSRIISISLKPFCLAIPSETAVFKFKMA